MKKFFRSKKIIAISLIIIVLGTWFFIKRHRHSASPAQEAIVVDVAKVTQGNIAIEAQAVGTLVAAKNVQLTTEMAGQVSKILAHDGVFVKEGTPLVQLDDTVNKAKAESAKANLTFSEVTFNRMSLLGKKGVIAQQTIDQASANLKEKRALEKENRILADKMLIKAPFDGVIGKIKLNPGEHVSAGQAIVSVTDTRNLRVEFNISEKFLANLKLGQQVTLKTSAYPGKEFYGKVSYIAPTINTEDRTISIYADVPNQDGKLTAGLFVNVTHLLGQESQVLLIPADSLVATIDGQQVYKMVDGKAVAVQIKVAQRTANQVQILDGLKLGDVVVTAGQHKLKDGTSIKTKA